MMKKLVLTALAAGLCAVTAAHAEQPAAVDAAKGQQLASTVCVGCHGADGNSAVPTFPKLSGQQPEYIAKQLAEFKAGTRANPIMLGMAAGLSPEDMKSVAAYYGAQTPAPGAAKDRSLAAAGQKLYRGGNSASGIAACAGCHGPNGAGIPAQYPRLAGQHADYIAAELKKFRSGERKNDPNKMMQTIAGKMTDQEISAVAEFIAGLQ